MIGSFFDATTFRTFEIVDGPPQLIFGVLNSFVAREILPSGVKGEPGYYQWYVAGGFGADCPGLYEVYQSDTVAPGFGVGRILLQYEYQFDLGLVTGKAKFLKDEEVDEVA